MGLGKHRNRAGIPIKYDSQRPFPVRFQTTRRARGLPSRFRPEHSVEQNKPRGGKSSSAWIADHGEHGGTKVRNLAAVNLRFEVPSVPSVSSVVQTDVHCADHGEHGGTELDRREPPDRDPPPCPPCPPWLNGCSLRGPRRARRDGGTESSGSRSPSVPSVSSVVKRMFAARTTESTEGRRDGVERFEIPLRALRVLRG